MAFWSVEDSANPDNEVLVALRAAMASVPEAMLIALTSVYARRGEVWRIFEKHSGSPSADILVVNGPTQTMNPTIDPHVIASAYDDDPVAAAAEYGAEFRSDVEQILPLDALNAVRMVGRFELPPMLSDVGTAYVGFLNPAGGTGKDSMTMAIAHLEGGVAVLDMVYGRSAHPSAQRPPSQTSPPSSRATTSPKPPRTDLRAAGPPKRSASKASRSRPASAPGARFISPRSQ